MGQKPTPSTVEWFDPVLVLDDAYRNALRALQVFDYLIEDGSLDLDNLDLDRADSFVAKVEEFVTAYRELYGEPVR